MRYCPFCNFRILSTGASCPNCHKSLPLETGIQGPSEPEPIASMPPEQAQGYAQELSSPYPPRYDFDDSDDEEEEDPESEMQERTHRELQKSRARREKKLRRRIMVSRIKMVTFLVIAILVLASEGYIDIPEPMGSPVKPAVDLAGDGVDAVEGLWEDATAKYYKVHETAEFILNRTITITADTDREQYFEIQLAKPPVVDSFYGDPIQEVKRFSYEVWEGSAELDLDQRDADGNRWYIFTGTVPRGETTKISIEYHIKENTYQWDDVDSSDSGTVNDVPQKYKKFLTDESIRLGRNSSDYRPLVVRNEVKSLTEQVTAGQDTIYGQIRSIYRYIIDNVKYLTVRGKVKACDKTLEDGRGDCDDMSVLFAAMARSIGIPAWMTYGYLTNEHYLEWGGHAWINVYIPVKNSHGGFDDIIASLDISNNIFMWHSPTRFIEWNSTSDSDDLSDFYYYTNVPADNIDQDITRDSLTASGTTLVKVEEW